MSSSIKQKMMRVVMSATLFVLVIGRADAADKAAELRREQLAKVKRIAVLPLFFGSDTLRDKKSAAAKVIAKPDKKEKPENAPSLEEFRAQLRKMEARANERLPERVKERTPYLLIPEKEQQEAFKAAELHPFDLFENAGVMKGIKFALPNIDAIKKLTKSLKADALLLGTMEEPRRSNGSASLLSYTAPHVGSRIIYYLFLPDGTDVFHYTMDVVRPLSRIGTRESGIRDYGMVDWLETVDQNIENFLDELARYTPAK